MFWFANSTTSGPAISMTDIYLANCSDNHCACEEAPVVVPCLQCEQNLDPVPACLLGTSSHHNRSVNLCMPTASEPARVWSILAAQKGDMSFFCPDGE